MAKSSSWPAKTFGAVLITGLSATTALAQNTDSILTSGLCGSLRNVYGPFDYRNATSEQRGLVEGAHFPPMVETLRKGHRGYLAGDIDYTLRAFPNHPRALSAMARLAKREGTLQPQGARFPVECYFDRALRFRPDDPWPRVLYAIFLIEDKRPDEAKTHLARISDTDLTDAQLIYNLGLAYYHLGDFARSQQYAKHAYELGITVPGLRNLLRAKGHWAE